MKLYKTRLGIVLEAENQFYFLSDLDWDTLINQDNLHETLTSYTQTLTASDEYKLWLTTDVLAPLGRQEIWAAGVTYLRSRDARMEESQDAGGGSFYDRVYDAERPEIFFKATPERVANPLGQVRIRKDSQWNVPEPELTLFITSSGKIVGYTCGNDMSSRDIEGENPLYLPQAKSYDGSAAIGPCLYVPSAPIDPGTAIRLTILRNDSPVFDQQIAISQMKRQHTELVSFLFRECSFAYGCYLMTGTGIVPPDDFTLQSGDEIHIQIDGIGTLINTVA
ncbi:fumarylacetoacetate hydrolase family protein [Siphonobacter sp. SORGH_AS_0500]|uniref:fumarylacetoacetate hydrolase family protein n=1 Tax=Siphonobacter sp. SORGH_AS_0500 TaxID=1864824 RepID=UPI00285EF08C|nr:fumarylacetoacetate hydrolase family protein [Siphonobacter sp. SORGH_AS_0500]MDR6194207.1 2-dehydro-3-deoxy-D-arabinonate dehydratase [Siphonobacter sp. SORGH_AS_0500]